LSISLPISNVVLSKWTVGTGQGGYNGDNISAGSAQLTGPGGLAIDAEGNLYIADVSNHRIRKVDKNGIITTVAGNGLTYYGSGGFSGDGGLATLAQLNSPQDVAIDSIGNIYIADNGNQRVRKVDTNGIITTVAGNGMKGYNGDGGIAINAKLNSPVSIALDAKGNLYIADYDNHRVRKVNSNGIITTVAGNGIAGYNGDGGIATAAQLSSPIAVTVDNSGNLIISDYANNRIRKVTFVSTSSCQASTSTTNTSICPTALPYSWNGLTFNTAGSKTAHLTNAAGCDSAATLNLSINAQPTPAANNVCVGSTIQLTNATNGGVWASANNRATVNATGLVTGANAGGAVITYKKNGVTTTYNIIVNAIPAVPSIVYAVGAINPQLGASRGEFCINKTFGIVGIPAGGVFTTSNNAIVTINCSGIVNTVGLGNSAINYRYTNAKGCSNSRTMVGTVVNCAARGVAINEKLATTNEFSLYPNPAKSIVNLNIDCLVGAGSIVVTDLYGKQVKIQTLSMGTNSIDVANLSKGMYFVSTITNEGKTTKKLVVE